MGNALTVRVDPRLPAVFQDLFTPETMGELTTGVTAGFPILSIKGKVWRIRRSGEEQLHLDAQGNAMPTVDVVIVQSSPDLSKIYYENQYEEGSNEAPRCYSNDGKKPDVSVQAPINPICATCPNNVWGSRMTPQGKKSRLCSDSRRVAVVFAEDLYNHGADAEKFLLRVPPASLNPLKDYAEKILAPKGIPFFAVATRISFDPQVAHPQLKFAPARLVNEEEAESIVKMRGSPDILRVLAETQEFAAGGAAAGVNAGQQNGSAAAAPASPAPAANTPPAAKQQTRTRPATEEEAGDAVLNAPPPRAQQSQPAAKAPAAAVAQSPAPAAAEPAPAPKKRKTVAATTPVAAAPPPAEEEQEEAAPAPAAAAQGGGSLPANFDNLLDSILNG